MSLPNSSFIEHLLCAGIQMNWTQSLTEATRRGNKELMTGWAGWLPRGEEAAEVKVRWAV